MEETDTTTRKGNTANFKTKRKALSFNTTNTYGMKIFVLGNGSSFLSLGKPSSEASK